MAGNVVTASPISDLNPVWIALDATFVLTSAARGVRRVAARDFFTGYRKVAMKADEILLQIVVPMCKESTYAMSFKQSQRREDDIAIVTGTFRIDFDDEQKRVERCIIALGGMAPTTIRAPKTEAALVGKPFDLDGKMKMFDDDFICSCKYILALHLAENAMLAELKLPENVPGGRAQVLIEIDIEIIKKSILI